jgi:hypothetical protein
VTVQLLAGSDFEKGLFLAADPRFARAERINHR